MLELARVYAGYEQNTVLRGIDLAIPDRSVVALIGPNGAGKTTLLRCASGLLPATSGRIMLDGEDVTTWPADRRARFGIAHVPEGRGIFRRLTVRQNLRLQATSVSESDAIDRAVAAFPILGGRLDQTAGTLSGGEQQMLATARVYVDLPKYFLLDEVSIGLAPVIVDAIYQFLSGLRSEGAAVLLVEQYVTRALALADLVYVLNKGEVAVAGEPAEFDDEDLFERYLARV